MNENNNKSILEDADEIKRIKQLEDEKLRREYERESTARVRIVYIKKSEPVEYQPDHKFYIEVTISNERKVFVASFEDLSSYDNFNKCLLKRVALPASLFFEARTEQSKIYRFERWLFNTLVHNYPEIIVIPAKTA